MNDSSSESTPYSSPTTLSLIDDAVSVGDARDWLTALVDCQTNKHKLQSLRSQVHCHRPDAAARDQIDNLKAARERINQELRSAELGDLPVHIKVTVDYYVGDTARSDSVRSELV